jgi:hypothetical protein
VEMLGGWRDFDLPGETCGAGDRFAKLPERLQMPLNCFTNITFGLFQGFAGRYAPREIGHVSSPVVLGPLKDDGILLTHGFFSKSCGLKIDFSGPNGTSSPGCLGIVTMLGFEGCL